MIDLTLLINKLLADKKKLLLAAFIVVVFFYVDFAYILSVQIKGVSASGRKIAQTRKDLNILKIDLKNMQASIQRRSEGKEQAPTKEKVFVTENQITQLLDDIESLEKKFSVDIVNIKHGPVVAQAGNKQAPVSASAQLVPFEIVLDVNGDYHHLGSFINVLENGPIFISIQSFRITPNAANGFKQFMNLTLRTYVKK